MEAVFTKNVKGMFSPPTTPKTFYCPTHPTTPRRNKKKAVVEMTIKDATASLEGAHPQDPAHTLMPYSSPPVPDHLSPKSGPAWDLNQHSLSMGCHGNSSGTDISVQDSNSRFNESWPSRSDQGDGEVIGQSAEGAVGVEWKQEVGVANQNSQESILSRYVERFRRAPPTSRASRDMPTNPFWWKLDGDSAGDTPKDTTTPDTTPLDKNHTHTDPSPEVSGELSLDLHSQDLIEKSSSLFTSFSDSPPAQKYLNSLGKREEVPSPSSLSSDNRNSLKPTRKTWSGVDQQEEFKSALPSLRVTRLNPEQDILVQWRLQRKLEQARNESAAVNLRNRFYDPGGDKRQLRHRDFSHLLSAESSISQDQPCLATPPNSKCCSVEDSGALEVRPSHAALHCGYDCHTRGAVHLQGQEVPPQSLQEVQTGPPPQSSEMKKQEVQTRTGPLEQEVQTSSPHPPRPSQQEVEVCPPRQSGQQTRHTILPNGNAILESGPDKDEFEAGGSMATIDSAHETSAQTTSIPLLPTGNGGVATTGSAQERKASIPLLPTLQREGTSVESHTQECDSASVCSSDEKEALSGTLEVSEACSTAPPEHSSSVDREHSISTESSLATGGSPPTLTCKVPPTHGGLALRDMSLSEEEGFSMTFNTAERSMQCNTPEGRAMSTPMHNKAAANEGGAASPVLPLMSLCGDPSDPLQKADSFDPSANGFPWEYDMDDPLLKLLITKARLFETQIREIDSRLMGMQKETQ